MAGSKSISPSRRRGSTRSSTRPAAASFHRALLVIDNAPLQEAAWMEFHEARRRLDKVARDLHRHEQIDVPAYNEWLHLTFPIYITTLRELHQEVSNKGRQVQAVQALAALTGRSLKKLWREQKEYEADPEAFEARFNSASAGDRADDDPRAEDGDDFFDDDDRHGRSSRPRFGHGFDSAFPSQPPVRSTREARDIYRRLVQRLHPDRGGEFTPARQRLWHEVQQAWAAGDADWLSRLEVEWETANDVLGPNSPLSRLRRAIEELRAARRDTERKLRDYRDSFPWRFSLSAKKRALLHRPTEANFKHDIDFLQRQLAYLNATIAAWEDSRSSRRRNGRVPAF